MEIDLSKFFSTFFEEAEEHLANFENLLLSLDVGAPESEDLNAIFRAAHSIKGGAGTFGFNDIAALTHILENLLDRVRKGTTQLRPDMVDIFLRTGDVLAGMLAVHRDGAAPDPDAVAEVTEALTRLEQEAIHGSAAPLAPPSAAPSPSTSPAQSWRITLRLDANTPAQALLDALASYGELTHLEENTQDGKTRMVVSLRGAGEQDIRDSLGFVLSDDHFDIEAEAASSADATPSIEGEGETFGFFDDEPAATPAPASPAGEGEAFGFFDDEPAEATAAPAPAPVESTDYGFFEPLPDVAPDAPTGREGIDYGWLDPNAAKAAPPPAPTPTPAPAASPVPSVAMTSGEPPNPGRRATDKSESATIRVDVSKVDQLLNFVGELVITQSMLAQSASNLDPLQHTRLLAGIEQLQRNTRELQESVMSIRMIPMSTVFSRFPRVVRDLAGKLGKKVELRLVGEQTELDKGFVEKLVDPLTHLVRNSLDHGIESTEARRAKGKPETGMLTLAASQQGGNVVIEVRDDGAGLNRDRILAKARENGIPVGDNMSDSEVWLLIFEAGFSTAAEVTDVSGRGVGMDVVRKNIQSMGGSVEIESMAGIGSTMRIRLPLTLAILDGMLVDSGGETYILPLNAIRESLQPTPEQCKTVTGSGRVVQVREEYLPLIALHEVVGCDPKSTAPNEGIVMVIEVGKQHIALWVDELVGQQQVVVKNLESNYRRVRGISGATILGDGRVALIVDVAELGRSSTA